MDLSRGIMTSCDHNIERFLPWWHEHVQNHSDLPVAIFNYGLCDGGKRVTKKIGTLIEKQDISMKECLLQKMMAKECGVDDAR